KVRSPKCKTTTCTGIVVQNQNEGPCIVVYSAAWCLIRAPLFDGRFVCAVEAIENFADRIEKSWLILRHSGLVDWTVPVFQFMKTLNLQ
ncbi:unnamed protein product, partial [Prunus brigantina]